MKTEFLKMLVCPGCKGELDVAITEEDGEIKEATLRCSCGNRYKVTDYIPCFLEEQEP